GGIYYKIAAMPNGKRERLRFRETHRDQWSVYLGDDSRKMQMQIDVHRNWIRLAWPGHPMADQYRITSAR
nr:hypothetical protein [Thiolinea sp.]